MDVGNAIYPSIGLVLVQTATPQVYRIACREPVNYSGVGLFCEILKIVLSYLFLSYKLGSLSSAYNVIKRNFASALLLKPGLYAYYALPALLYMASGYLSIFVASFVDPLIIQVASQLKIPFTAVLSVVFLKRTYNPVQWASVCILTASVAMVEVDSYFQKKECNAQEKDALVATIEQPHLQAFSPEKFIVACLALFLVAFISGVCTVLLSWIDRQKRILGRGQQEQAEKPFVSALEGCNVMAFYSALFSFLLFLAQNLGSSFEHKRLSGYWLVYILLSAVWGLLSTVLLIVSDPMIKTFANAASLILTFIVSIFTQAGLRWSFAMTCGTFMTIVAFVTFSRRVFDRWAAKWVLAGLSAIALAYHEKTWLVWRSCVGHFREWAKGPCDPLQKKPLLLKPAGRSNDKPNMCMKADRPTFVLFQESHHNNP